MSTVISDKAAILEDSSSNDSASNKVLKSTYDSVLGALKNNKKIILITGAAKAGKTVLIHNLCKNIADKHRIITLSGKDLPSLHGSDNKQNDNQLNNIKDFILESTDIGDELIIVLDDAQCLPISFLSTLVERSKKSTNNKSRLQLILSGPLDFKDQLLEIEQLSENDLSHYPIDSLNEEKLRVYAKNKPYKISSNIKRIEFKPKALSTLTDFIQSDQQILDVILEWCAALVNKDQLTYISEHTVSRAINFAQQFSRDKSLRLSNSYPPSHNVYKYINDAQSTKATENSANASKVYKKSINKVNKSKTFTPSRNKPNVQQSKFPAITSKKIDPIEDDGPVPKLVNDGLRKLPKIENEIMQPQWTAPSKVESTGKKSFSVLAGLLSVLVLSFITFIAFRIGSDPSIDEATKQQIVLNEPKETIIENKLENDASNSREIDADKIIEIQNVPAVTEPLPAPEIIANNTENSASITKTDKESVLLISSQEQEQNQPPSNTSSKELYPEHQQSSLALQETTNSKDNTALTAEIDDLLVLAESQLENKNLSTPPGDNALETYQKILTQFPNHESAISGVNKVHDRYINWANYYYKNNQNKRAKYFYNKALSIDPTNTETVKYLENIARQEAAHEQSISNTLTTENSIQSDSVQPLLIAANEKMQQIKTDINTNNRNYKAYQEAQTTYQAILRLEPNNAQATQGLSSLINYYADWAEQQILSKNYNIALFLYGQALAIQPDNSHITQRIEQIRELNNVL